MLSEAYQRVATGALRGGPGGTSGTGPGFFRGPKILEIPRDMFIQR